MVVSVGTLLAALVALLAGAPDHMQLPVPTPIGVGPAYTLAPGPAKAGAGTCLPHRRAVSAAHVELFARGRALLLPPGIGVGDGCRYAVWTSEPTGVIHVARPGLTLRDLFAVWGQPLARHRLAGFDSATPVRAYVDGRRVRGPVGDVRLGRHAEIVVELGHWIAPHSFYVFPEGT